MRACRGRHPGGPFLFSEVVVKDEKVALSEEKLGTPEEIAAAEAAYREAKETGAPFRECQRLSLAWGRLNRYRVKRPKGRPLRLVAQGGVVALYDPVADARSAYVMQEYTKLTEKYGPRLMEERLQDAAPAVRHKALSELHDLLKAAYRAEQEAVPKRKSEPRKVVVRGWPAEGSKS